MEKITVAEIRKQILALARTLESQIVDPLDKEYLDIYKKVDEDNMELTEAEKRRAKKISYSLDDLNLCLGSLRDAIYYLDEYKNN